MYVTKDTPRPRRTAEERDQQKSKLYKAEKILKPMRKSYPEMADVQAYVVKVQASKVLQRRFGGALTKSFEVGDGRRRTNAGGGYWGIYMPRWSRTDQIILHEMAHTILIRMQGSNVSAHGWMYANVYLQLVKTMMGAAAHDMLKESFREHRVRFAEKKTRAAGEVTPEMIERLARAREIRMANLVVKKKKAA